jgi:hypothetical protein
MRIAAFLFGLILIAAGCVGAYQAIGLRDDVSRFITDGGAEEISYFGRDSTINARMFAAFICLFPVALIISGTALLNSCCR